MGVVTLGLDLGVASIGWALVNEENGTHKLIHWGSRIFHYLSDRDQGSAKGAVELGNRRVELLRKYKVIAEERKG